mmetsp:Transcript_103500/g.292635  ORF Transcript_103500/g.292635 Transcript_103500/m.292635 type:complete len:513 (-) Transcript_103500:2923-4461(-)
MLEQPAHCLRRGSIASEAEPGAQEETQRPHPLGALVVVPPVRDGLVRRFIAVVVVTAILRVLGIQSAHAKRPNEPLGCNSKRLSRILGGEQLGRHSHGNAKVWPQLVVLPATGRTVRVLVDGADTRWGFLVRSYPEHIFEAVLQAQIPVGVGELRSAPRLDGGVGKQATVKARHPAQRGLQQADYLHRGAVARGCGHTQVSRGCRRTVLVHPGATVPGVASVENPGRLVQPHVNVEAVVVHVLVDSPPRVPLSERDPLRVRGQDEVDKVCQSARLQLRQVSVPVTDLPFQRHRCREEGGTFRGHAYIVLDGLQEKPCRIARIVAWIVRRIQKVRAQTVANDARVDQDCLACLNKPLGHKQATTQRNECVPAPVPHETSGKVREACRKRRQPEPALPLRALPVQRRTWSGSPELGRGQSQVPHEVRGGAVLRDEAARTVQDSLTSSHAQRGNGEVEAGGHKLPRQLRNERLCASQPVLHLREARHFIEAGSEVAQEPVAFTNIVDQRAAEKVW